MDYEEYKRKALEPIVNYIESVMASYSKEELEDRIKKALSEKESEDERIRKMLISLVKHHADILEQQYEKDMLFYLEKQKEHVSDNFDDVWTTEDCAEIIEAGEKLSPRFKELLKEVCHAWYDKGIELEKQKEQKPNVELIQKSWYLEGYHDGKYNNEPKWLIQTGKEGPMYGENPKYGTQNPAEWSEEDEKMIDKCIELVLFAMPANMSAIKTKEQCITWLKSLRPQPHWRPSEEQIEALNSIILTGSFTYVGQTQDLISLKDELKKL